VFNLELRRDAKEGMNEMLLPDHIAACLQQTRYHDGHARNNMKELFTKSFREGVKKTFQAALEGPQPTDNTLQTPAEGDLRASSTSETPSSPSVSSERH
jgi:hypothetical protein